MEFFAAFAELVEEKPFVSCGTCWAKRRTEDDMIQTTEQLADLRKKGPSIHTTRLSVHAPTWAASLNTLCLRPLPIGPINPVVSSAMSKPALSGRVLGMKFMQKANEKKLLLEAEEKQEVR